METLLGLGEFLMVGIILFVTVYMARLALSQHGIGMSDKWKKRYENGVKNLRNHYKDENYEPSFLKLFFITALFLFAGIAFVLPDAFHNMASGDFNFEDLLLIIAPFVLFLAFKAGSNLGKNSTDSEIKAFLFGYFFGRK